MISKIRNFCNSFSTKPAKYYLFILLMVILAALLVYLLTTGVMKIYRNVATYQSMGKSVLYDINNDKMLSNTPVTAQISPEVALVEHKASKEVPNEQKAKAPSINAKPLISIIVVGIGLNAASVGEVESLPAAVTIGLSPYSPDIGLIAKKLSDVKHELLINLPLEPNNYPEDDPGPYGLLTTLTEQDNLQRLNYLVSRSDNIEGVYSMNDEQFTKNIAAIGPVIKFLKERKLTYLYAGDPSNLEINQVSSKEQYNIINIDYVIDDKISEENINNQLNKALETAKKNGYVTVLCRPYPVSIDNLKKWIDSLMNKDIQMVGLSEIVKITKGDMN